MENLIFLGSLRNVFFSLVKSMILRVYNSAIINQAYKHLSRASTSPNIPSLLSALFKTHCENQTLKLKAERLPGGSRKFTPPVNNNIETREHFCSTANPEGEDLHTPQLSKILPFEGGYDEDTHKERRSSD